MTFLPPIVTLCGNPTSGKSTAANILVAEYGYQLVDDGLPLRQIAMKYFGLTEHQVFTQEGKLEVVELNGREWTVREILGEIGNAFEEKFGADIIPIMSHRLFETSKRYVLGSVRRDQGIYWAKQGALIVEIYNPAAGPSRYEFDRYNPAPVQVTINNQGKSLVELHRELARLLDTYQLAETL